MLLESSIFTFLCVRVTGFLPMGSLVEECWTPQELTGIQMNHLQPSVSWFEVVRHSHKRRLNQCLDIYASRRYCIMYLPHKNIFTLMVQSSLNSHVANIVKVCPCRLRPKRWSIDTPSLATCSQAVASLTWTGAVGDFGGFKLHLNHPKWFLTSTSYMTLEMVEQ